MKIASDITSVPLRSKMTMEEVIFISLIQFTENVTILLTIFSFFKYINSLIKAIILCFNID